VVLLKGRRGESGRSRLLPVIGSTTVTTFSFLTFILLVLTIWVGISRFTRGLEGNWPLVYYLLMVAHLKAFEGGLNPYWVYVGVVSALFLRFEFMGGVPLKVVRVLELAALAYVAWRSLALVLMW
jgi:hypothetical protein